MDTNTDNQLDLTITVVKNVLLRVPSVPRAAMIHSLALVSLFYLSPPTTNLKYSNNRTFPHFFEF